ncbi:MAG: zf-HC2 domain-containing protein [Oscillospiraceae bacterium]|nr:zf-HC2 domain-containing protein [Oscillospiraceae bacterium]
MNCKIIQDLLPLYADGIASEETNEAVSKHIAECEECGKIYEKMTAYTKIIESAQTDRDVNYMKKIKSRGKKTTAAIVGGVSAAIAIALLCVKLFYWGFAVTSDDIDIICNMRKHGDDVDGSVYVEFTVEMKNGMTIRHDFSEYTSDDCIYHYITPKAVFRMPFDMPKDQSSFLIAYNKVKDQNQFNHELNIILEDTSYNYDIDKMAEEFWQNEEKKWQVLQ